MRGFLDRRLCGLAWVLLLGECLPTWLRISHLAEQPAGRLCLRLLLCARRQLRLWLPVHRSNTVHWHLQIESNRRALGLRRSDIRDLHRYDWRDALGFRLSVMRRHVNSERHCGWQRASLSKIATKIHVFTNSTRAQNVSRHSRMYFRRILGCPKDTRRTVEHSGLSIHTLLGVSKDTLRMSLETLRDVCKDIPECL